MEYAKNPDMLVELEDGTNVLVIPTSGEYKNTHSYMRDTLRGLGESDWRMDIITQGGLNWDRDGYDKAQQIRSIQRAKKFADEKQEIQNKAVQNTEQRAIENDKCRDCASPDLDALFRQQTN